MFRAVRFGIAQAAERDLRTLLFQGDIEIDGLLQGALGPFTVTRFLSLIVICTPLGTSIGAFPMRDIFFFA